ncbi:MAG: response regulator [Planctomycetes bacterium]|nr:response regulator [Planctomycetota bacterium]MCB9905764.1 response regulator [Planctomycetota bacterium]
MARILLIDDDEVVRTVFARLLTAAGHEVRVLADGAGAAGVVEEGAIDLVITDLIMPGQEGMATIGELRGRWAELPILAISGGGRVSALDLLPVARSLGANATLPKPISAERLFEVVDRLAG